VTDRYLAHVREADAWTLEEATWFLAICAALLQLKVGRLMPRPEEPLDEEDLAGGSPDLAYARSLELAAFRHVARWLATRIEEESAYHPRLAGPPEAFAHLYPDVLAGIVPEDLARTAAAALRPPPALDLSHVTPIRFSVSDAIAHVEGRLEAAGAAAFRELVADCEDRMHVVVRFLAILELYREGKVDLRQGETFGEIVVRWEGSEAP
jgi:segregation and condensation protein A